MIHMSNDLSFSFEDFPQFINSLSGNTALLLVSHQTTDGEYKSATINLDSLAIQLRNKSIHARSAAYYNSTEFALANHDHDIYTSATYSTTFHDGDTISNVLSMHDVTNDKDYNVALSVINSELTPDEYEHIQSTLSAKRPKLGELRFIAVSDLQIYKDMFDPENAAFVGWVPADGKTYNINDFILSDYMHLVFNAKTADTFYVPQLQEFCKINDSFNSSSYEIQTGKNALKQHNHNIGSIDNVSFNVDANKNDIEYTESDYHIPTQNLVAAIENRGGNLGKEILNGEIKSIPPIKCQGGFPSVHYGHNFLTAQKMTFTNNLASNAFESNIASIEYDGNKYDISYPSYNKMPSLIYVGYSKWSIYNEIIIDH